MTLVRYNDVLKHLLTILIILFGIAARAQQKSLKITADDPQQIDIEFIRFNNEKEKRDALNKIRLQLQADGYLEASIDSISKTSAFFHVGPQYRFADLRPGNVDEEVLTTIGFRAKVYQSKPLALKTLNDLYDAILTYYENRGHPFASVGMDSLRMSREGELEGALSVDVGPVVVIDTIIIKGDAKLSRELFSNYIGIGAGDPYDQSRINSVSLRIKELAYISEVKPAELVFLPEKAQLYVYVTGRNANRLNGILGVLPDRETGEITITGDAQIRLRNALGRGELIDLNWRKLQALTQDMTLQFAYPYLFDLPVGIQGDFKLYRRDTTFIELKPRIMFQYLLQGGNYIGVYIKSHSSRLIQPEDYAEANTLPSFSDTRTVQYGLSVFQQKLDYQVNPRKGYSIQIDGGLGRKEITPLRELNPSVYDDIDLNSIQYDITTEAKLFIPTFDRMTIMLRGQAAILYNEQMFSNEMYRVGGIRTLRGFDEESIRASTYAIGTIEYRFLLEQNSNLYVFFDGAWYEDRTEGAYSRDIPYGFGAGISFQTRPGIFSINYALGSQQGNPVLFRAAKVHFGFVNYF